MAGACLGGRLIKGPKPAAWQAYCALCLLACAAIAQRKANAAASHAVLDGPLAKSTASAIGIVRPYFWAKEVISYG